MENQPSNEGPHPPAHRGLVFKALQFSVFRPRSSALLSGPGSRNGRNFVPGCEMKKAFLLLQCALPILAGCAANSTPAPAPTPVSVLVTPSSTTVAPGTSAQLTASVTGDSAGKGVSWTVTCSTQQCGSVSPASTPSGVPTTYTAPSPPSTSLTVTITAVSATATITVTKGVGVSVSPGTASVAVTGTQLFTATVTNDPSNKGVSWTLTQGGAVCSPSCGTIAPAMTASGSPATYTAPFTIPANPSVTVVATSVANTTVSATAPVAVIAAVGVSVSPGTANVSVNATQQFTATVANDASNQDRKSGV